MKLLIPLLLVLPVVTMAHASYGDCDSKGYPALGIVEVTPGSADFTFYVDDRNYLLGNGLWIYQETNGIWKEKPAGVYFGDPQHESLQRGSHCDFLPDDCEICTDDWNVPPDMYFF